MKKSFRNIFTVVFAIIMTLSLTSMTNANGGVSEEGHEFEHEHLDTVPRGPECPYAWNGDHSDYADLKDYVEFHVVTASHYSKNGLPCHHQVICEDTVFVMACPLCLQIFSYTNSRVHDPHTFFCSN